MKPDDTQPPVNEAEAPAAEVDVASEVTPENSGPVVTMSGGVKATRSDDRDTENTLPEEDPVHWQATEYIQRDKNAGWYVIFAVVVLGLIAIAIFMMKSWSFALLVAVMAAAVVVYTNRPPRVLSYTLSSKGLYINDRLYGLGDFKSFSVVKDLHEFSIVLIPTKRFAPVVSVYFPEAVGEQIVDLLGSYLPMEERDLDFIDKLIRKLRL